MAIRTIRRVRDYISLYWRSLLLGTTSLWRVVSVVTGVGLYALAAWLVGLAAPICIAIAVFAFLVIGQVGALRIAHESEVELAQWRFVPAEVPHVEQLRAIAAQLEETIRDKGVLLDYTDGASRADLLKEMFTAHFPAVVDHVEEYRQARSDANRAFDALEKEMLAGARQQFPTDQGWDTDAITRRCFENWDSLVWSEGDQMRGEVRYEAADRSLRWGSDVLRRGTTEAEAVRVDLWANRVFGHTRAKTYRAAREKAGHLGQKATDAIEPLVNYAPINKVATCRICCPPPE